MPPPRITGILPAAGLATRLKPLRYPKELLPVVFTRDEPGAPARPMLAAEYSLAAMREGGIARCYIVIAEWKTEIMRYFGDGGDFGLSVAYLRRDTARGLADAVDAAHPWLAEGHTCLALPDTVFRPRHAIAAICDEIGRSGADIVLGVFPTTRPELLGPVRFGEDRRVTEVQDKPAQTDLRNCWGVAVWSPRFSNYLHAAIAAAPAERSVNLGLTFHRAIGDGLGVRAVAFPNGSYTDVGTPDGIAALLQSPSGD